MVVGVFPASGVEVTVGVYMIMHGAQRRSKGPGCAYFHVAAGCTRAEGGAVQRGVRHVVEVSTEPDTSRREERQGGNQGVCDESSLIESAVGPVGVSEVEGVTPPGDVDAGQASAGRRPRRGREVGQGEGGEEGRSDQGDHACAMRVCRGVVGPERGVGGEGAGWVGERLLHPSANLTLRVASIPAHPRLLNSDDV